MIPGCPRGQDAPDADAPPTWVRVNADGALVDEAAPAPAPRTEPALPTPRPAVRVELDGAWPALAEALATVPDLVLVDDERAAPWAWRTGEAVFRGSVTGRGPRAVRLCDPTGDCVEVETDDAEEARGRLVAWARWPEGEPLGPAAEAPAWLEAGDGDALRALAEGRPELRRDPRVALPLALGPCARPGGGGGEVRLDPACLGRLPEPFQREPAVLRALARAAESPRLPAFRAWAAGDATVESALAARAVALDEADYAAARELDALARARGHDADERQLRLALAVAAEDLAAAEELARWRRTKQQLAAKRRGEPTSPAAEARQTLDRGETRAALAQAEAILARHPHDPDAWAIKARALAELGRNQEAGAAVLMLEQVDPLAADAAMVRRLIGG